LKPRMVSRCSPGEPVNTSDAERLRQKSLTQAQYGQFVSQPITIPRIADVAQQALQRPCTAGGAASRPALQVTADGWLKSTGPTAEVMS
jgi:hypothetical protein